MSFILRISYLKHLLNEIKFLYIVLKFLLKVIVIAFLYTRKYIVYNSQIRFNLVIILSTLKSFFHCFLNIKYDLILFIIINILIFKISRLISINIFEIFFIFGINLHFIFKNFFIFFISVNIITLVFFYQ